MKEKLSQKGLLILKNLQSKIAIKDPIHDVLLEFIQMNPKAYVKILKNRLPEILDVLSDSYGDSFPEKIYNFIYKNVPCCKNCNEVPTFINFSLGYREYCSMKCRSNSIITKEKQKSTSMIKYGVDHHFKNDNIKRQLKETWSKNLGVDNPGKSLTIQNSIKTTLKKKYGVISAFHIPSVKSGMIKKFGVDNMMKDPEVFQKQQQSSYRIKEFIFPSGKMIYVRGYENVAIHHLLHNGIEESSIITSPKLMPRFEYLMDEKVKKYYPDIFLPELNLIIEVKSLYTYKTNYERNVLKAQSVLEKGINFSFYICDSESIKEIIEMNRTY